MAAKITFFPPEIFFQLKSMLFYSILIQHHFLNNFVLSEQLVRNCSILSSSLPNMYLLCTFSQWLSLVASFLKIPSQTSWQSSQDFKKHINESVCRLRKTVQLLFLHITLLVFLAAQIHPVSDNHIETLHDGREKATKDNPETKVSGVAFLVISFTLEATHLQKPD